MVEELNKKIRIAQEHVRVKTKMEKQLITYNKELEYLHLKLEGLKATLHLENQDVEKLEGLSVNALFLTILGTKDERLLQEKQEAALAKLLYDEVKAELNSLQDEIKTIKNNLEGVCSAEEELKQLLSEKEQYIKTQYSLYINHMDQLGAENNLLSVKHQELEEALVAAVNVRKSLNNVIASLENAKGWGTFDLFDGSVLSTALKHNHVDEAKNYMHDAQHLAKKLQKELEDIGLDFSHSIDLTSLAKFADYFFDGLITDWVIQNEINDSLEQVKVYNDQVLAIVRRINAEQLRVITQMNKIDFQKKQLIEQAV
ncbi:DNA repair exonuclease SbcCD ATPase subunit [Bacillus mesophilus]|uniref:Uncharacterized protein n=1 Tax=Bacillus mesophilus TaxID=1808955 RepID=A0A6M0Q2V2_9BACI|nr:hypothetical protein [Bacillus mesophilus]MBM7659852.1 DNA repair exonuclease SbcCD ATPase subunit [Bacillus mesophilus]NEY70711.1 hypothetical protein [Bacillus mesophilus]